MSEEQTNKSRALAIKLPRLSGVSAHTLILILLIVVGALQTAQLYGLKTAVAASKSKPAVSAPASSGGSGDSQLPTMVGGC